MQGELYQYFILFKQLNIPGVGTFLLERKPAVVDFPNKQIQPPVYSIALHTTHRAPSKIFFNWLAGALHISDREAVVQFNDFAFDLKKQVQEGNKVSWTGIGTLSAGLAGEIRFEPALKNTSFESPVKAEKVIRENASHFVRVGEDEKTSVEMTELLARPEASRNSWWVIAVVTGLLSFLFIGWYLSGHGVNVSATGYGKKIQASSPNNTYRQLP
jgi:hypothetical protein